MARVRFTLLAALTAVLCCVCPAAWAASGPCPDAYLLPHAGNLERIRVATLCLVNQERERRGESALRQNAQIEKAAQRHTEDMAFRDYFEHVGPSGDTPLDRLRASRYVYNDRIGYEVGENIAWGTLELSTPQAIVAAWMASPAHRANILDGRYRDTAIGVSPHPPQSLAHGQAGGIYTQDFGVLVVGGAARHGGARRGAAQGRLRPLQSRGWRRRPKAAEPGPSTFPVKRRSKGHGSTRRKVRHRHRLGARHRPRHRRAAGRAGRKHPHQRPRRRRR